MFIFTCSVRLLSVININLLTSCIIASECTFAEMCCVGCEGQDDGGIVLVLYCYVLIWKYVTRPLTLANITMSYIGEESEHVSHYWISIWNHSITFHLKESDTEPWIWLQTLGAVSQFLWCVADVRLYDNTRLAARKSNTMRVTTIEFFSPGIPHGSRIKFSLFYLTTHINFHPNHFAWQQAAQNTPLFEFSASRCSRILVQRTAVSIKISFTVFI